MDNKELLLASLYEISMSIGTSLDLDEILKSSISKYIEKLNCIGAVVVEQNRHNIIFSKPKTLKNNSELSNLIDNIDELCKNNYIVFEKYDTYFYIASLDDFGYLILLRKTNQFELKTCKALVSLNNKLSNAIVSSINSSKLIESERIMLHQSRLASMGEMIGNIAHQWRQPLAAMSASLQNIELAYEVGKLDKELLSNQVNIAKKTAKHMSKTIDDFRNFFKPDKSKELFDIKMTINNIIQILSSALKNNNINIEVLEKKEDIFIYGHESELTQALLNVLSNAKDALIELESDVKNIFIDIKLVNDEVVINIIDNAGGMKEDILLKVFEPYFTTKEQGKGTGIGLYMTRIIIQEHMNGSINVYLNDIGGSTFEIKIPYSEVN